MQISLRQSSMLYTWEKCGENLGFGWSAAAERTMLILGWNMVHLFLGARMRAEKDCLLAKGLMRDTMLDGSCRIVCQESRDE